MPESGVHLTEAQREELAPKAYEMYAKGQPMYSIAKELGINRNTVSRLIKLETKKRRPEHANAPERLVAGHEATMREAWGRLAALPKNASGHAVGACLTAITNSLKAIADLTGANAPKEVDVTRRNIDQLDLTKLTDEQLDQLLELVRVAGMPPEDIADLDWPTTDRWEDR